MQAEHPETAVCVAADGGIKDTISWKFIVDYNGTQFANVTTLDVRDFLVKYNVPKVREELAINICTAVKLWCE